MESIADFIKRTAKERQQQNAAAAGIVLNTTDKNPDDVALNLNLANDWAKTTGKPVPPLPLVEEYRPVFQKQINDKQNSTILADAPKLSEWLKNPDNAALAQDDLPGLSWWERLPNSFRMGTATGIKQGQEFTKDVGMVLERGALGQGLDALGKEFDQLVLTNDQGTPNLLGQLANYARSLSTAQDKIPRRMVGGPDVTPNQRADAIENADLGQLYKGATALLSEMEKNGFSPMSYKDVGSLSGAAQFISENLATSLPHTVASIASGG
ncbi:MAG: hypothetical protein IT544_00520, partial [Rhodobacteraceae bacterium]|nr:hypothetical protein [Paracoccaceae bacterium]